MKKAIFFDIDGTLIDCLKGITEITSRVKKGIKIKNYKILVLMVLCSRMGHK
ncbi:MAG: hypothetical protein K0R06_2883 [Clostridium sp.]|nr:hypothetical protein [Clostridium sp.]